MPCIWKEQHWASQALIQIFVNVKINSRKTAKFAVVFSKHLLHCDTQYVAKDDKILLSHGGCQCVCVVHDITYVGCWFL